MVWAGDVTSKQAEGGSSYSSPPRPAAVASHGLNCIPGAGGRATLGLLPHLISCTLLLNTGITSPLELTAYSALICTAGADSNASVGRLSHMPAVESGKRFSKSMCSSLLPEAVYAPTLHKHNISQVCSVS